MLQVMWLVLTDQSTLFQSIVVTLPWNLFDISSSGQSYKASTTINYDSTVVITSKLLKFMTLDLKITIVEAL